MFWTSMRTWIRTTSDEGIFQHHVQSNISDKVGCAVPKPAQPEQKWKGTDRGCDEVQPQQVRISKPVHATGHSF